MMMMMLLLIRRDDDPSYPNKQSSHSFIQTTQSRPGKIVQKPSFLYLVSSSLEPKFSLLGFIISTIMELEINVIRPFLVFFTFQNETVNFDKIGNVLATKLHVSSFVVTARINGCDIPIFCIQQTRLGVVYVHFM